MGLTVKVKGLDDLRKRSAAAARAIEIGIERAVQDTLDDVADEARDDVPIGETHGLRDGIGVERDGMEGVVGVFGEAREYAKYPEFGTSSQSPQPFMSPAAERARRQFVRNVETEVRKALE